MLILKKVLYFYRGFDFLLNFAKKLVSTIMSTLSDKAFAVMAVCPEAKRYYGMTVDYLSRDSFKFVWAFKIDKEKAHREGYDSKTVNGSTSYDQDYPGCPYCKAKEVIFCPCGTIFCWRGESYVTCPECGRGGRIKEVEKVNLKGGGY